jgi:hypothetical protein
MAGSIVGPLAIGAVAAVLGAGVALWAGWPLWAAFAAYSICGAAGLLAGALLNLRGESPRRRRESREAPSGPLPPGEAVR